VPFDDRTTDAGFAARSLSEQLRDLEAQLGPGSGHEHDLSLPRGARRSTLPTHLGRPIGLTEPNGFPRIDRLIPDQGARVHPSQSEPSPGAAFRRGATVIGVGLLLLATTAIVPPLFLRHPVPVATESPEPAKIVTVARTERFAQSARELRDAEPAVDIQMLRTTDPSGTPAHEGHTATTDRATERTTSRYEPTSAAGEAALDAFPPLPPR